jgi:hypothetical protein
MEVLMPIIQSTDVGKDLLLDIYKIHLYKL